MRKLTQYEKETWFDNLNRFEPPAFLGYGDELGEYYDSLCRCEDYASTYGSPEFASAIQVEILDTHYSNVDWLVENEGLKDVDSLPSLKKVQAKFKELGGKDEIDWKKALDWAHIQATLWQGSNRWAE